MYKYVQNRILASLKMLLLGLDILSLNALFMIALDMAVHFSFLGNYPEGPVYYSQVWLVYNLLYVMLALYFRLYSDQNLSRLESLFRSSFRVSIWLMLLFPLTLLVDDVFKYMYGFVLIWWALLVFYMLLSRFFMTYIYIHVPKRMKLYKRVALIGSDAHVAYYADYFDKQSPFFHVNTIEYKDSASLENKEETLSKFRWYFKKVARAGIHDVFIVTSPGLQDYTKELVAEADHQCVQLNFVPGMQLGDEQANIHRAMERLELPVLKSHEEPMSSMENRVKKRVVDLLISGAVIVFVLSWMIPVVGIIIKFQSPGPIFFRQLRSGRNNKPFYCYKFRSMVVNDESNKKQASKDDSRITPIGRFLRRTNLDEFPQFLNVFVGQMSVVGPRPHMLSHTEHYSRLIQHYMVRHFVKPGITGWAQVNGYRGETKDTEMMAKRIEYDIEYLRNWSAMLDFKIVCMTAINMIKGEKNAY